MKRSKLAIVALAMMTLIISFPVLGKWKEQGDAKTYGGKGTEVPTAVVKAKDGGFFVAGYFSETYNSDPKGWVIKLDKDGKKEWNMIGAPGKIYTALAMDDGGYLVAGYAQGDTVKNGVFSRLDKKGKEVWGKPIGSAVSYILETKDKNYLLIGTGKSEGKGQDVMAAKYDKDGKQIWAFNYGTNFDETGSQGFENPDGSFMIAGTQALTSTGSRTDMYLLQIDKDGKLGLYKHYGWPNFTNGLFVWPMKDGNYLLAGVSTGIGKGGSEAAFIKVDKEGNKLWEKPWGGASADYLSYIVPAGDGFLISGMTKSFDDADGDGFFAKLDSDGNVSGVKMYGLKGWPDQVVAFVPVEDGYLFALDTQNFGDQSENLWMLKVDKNGDCKIKGCPGVK